MRVPRGITSAVLFLLASLPMWGAGNGLKGEYFNNTALSGVPAASRTDATVDFNWFGSPISGVASNYFSVRWSGKVEAPVTGAYKLATYSNEGIRVWLNGAKVIEDWTGGGARADSEIVMLTAGQQYDVKVEFHDSGSFATAKLLWSYPGQAEQVIPQARLYSGAPLLSPPPVYLSEMNPTVVRNGWGAYEKDRSNGESRPRDGRTMEIQGVEYGRGLGVHALSELRYSLQGRYKAFYADIGIDDEVGQRGSVIFEVWVDGVRKFSSDPMTGAMAAVPVALDITGANQLQLIVLDAGDGNAYDHADWAGARVVNQAVQSVPQEPVPPPPPPPNPDPTPDPTPNPTPTPQPPAIPTGLTATPGNAKVSLSWNAVGGATSYNVFRGTVNGVLGTPYQTGVAMAAFVDTGVTNGTTYYYRVAAVAGALASEPSLMVSAKPVAPVAAPGVPTGLAATPGNAQVSVTWSAVSGASGYKLYRSTAAGTQGSAVYTGDGTSFNNTGLTNGTTYYYSVQATNDGGASAVSAQVSAKPVAPPVSGVPTGLAATAGNAQVAVVWNAVSGATGYKLYRSTTAGTQGSAVYTGAETAFNNTGLTNGTTYYYSVASVNEGGTSAASAQVTAKPVAPPVPPAPTGLAGTAGNTEVTLNWSAVSEAATYNVYRSTTSGGQGDTPFVTGLTAPTFKDTGLTNNIYYYYKVAGVNLNGVGAKSSQVAVKPVLPPIPSAPTGVSATSGDRSITLSWNTTANATSYNVFRGTTSGGQGDTPLATGITGVTFLDTGLTNGTQYFYKVQAVGLSGASGRSAQVAATPAGPAVVLSAEQKAAFKFLRQATWGPTPALRDRVVQIGKAAWLDEQFALPATPYPQALIDMPNMELVSEQFFQNALQGQDQLRQRVAWALSQIWVVSAVKVDNTHAMVPYIRMLEENAFGNVRDLLEKVTLSPAMGEFLDMVNNKKANTTTGTMPNENYARELMQLFTIGLVQLNPDGSTNNAPAYGQSDILELARVLTGWTYGDAIAGDPTRINSRYYDGPMEPVAIYHDTGAKTVLGVNFPANQTARADLKLALDTLFNHPNLGPFLVKQLIQRLVKSNPTPQYISDVVAVFNNNGQGVRGDLQAVVRAILLHAETSANPNSGKFSEPALFLTTIARGLNATVVDHPYMTDFSQDMSQRIWFAPSVFNYFSPGYRLNGVLGPELQIWSTATAMTRTNFVAALVSGGFGTNFTIDTSPYLAVVGNNAALVDTADALLMGGTMGSEMRQAILTALGSATSNTDKIRTVLYLVGSSMQYQVEH